MEIYSIIKSCKCNYISCVANPAFKLSHHHHCHHLQNTKEIITGPTVRLVWILASRHYKLAVLHLYYHNAFTAAMYDNTEIIPTCPVTYNEHSIIKMDMCWDSVVSTCSTL